MKSSPQEPACEGETQHLDYGLDKQKGETIQISKVKLPKTTQKSDAIEDPHVMCHYSHVTKEG